MWVNSILGYGADILLSFYAVYLFFCYFDIFFKRKKDKRLSYQKTSIVRRASKIIHLSKHSRKNCLINKKSCTKYTYICN